jgi:predicted aldo/keto reductase-like oxidoreductase
VNHVNHALLPLAKNPKTYYNEARSRLPAREDIIMQYRLDQRSGNRLSVLGFGCMRLPRNLSGIDRKRAEQMFLYAIREGVNYFDTAYLYPGSEAILGAVLADNHLREQVYIATKLPILKCKNGEDFDKYLTRQLAALQMEYIDYYLMHSINTLSQWRQLCEWGIVDWLRRQKEAGKIRQIGFSFHGVREEFLGVLADYDWDFCQIQYNYANENDQAGVTGLKRAAEKGLPVIIMEPLLGGKLATGLPRKAQSLLREADPESSPASWALRWLWDQPEVTVVLSGMSDIEQVASNITTASGAVPHMLSAGERDTLKQVVNLFRESFKVPCTGCGYCMPCPQGVSIPGCFSAYNASFSLGRITGMIQYTSGTAATRHDHGMAGRCIACGKCERHCPQHIKIPTALRDVEKRLEPFYVKWALGAMRGRKQKD